MYRKCYYCNEGSFFKKTVKLSNGKEKNFYFCQKHKNTKVTIVRRGWIDRKLPL